MWTYFEAIIGGQIYTSGILLILNQPPNGDNIVIEVRYIHTIIRKQKVKASTEPSGDNITNVQECGQYRSKDTNSSEAKRNISIAIINVVIVMITIRIT